MPEHEPTPREQLVKLLRMDVGREISHEGFRIFVEELYNFKLDRRQLSLLEAKAFEHLFDVVVWYSDIPADRDKYPHHYKYERAIGEALDEARHTLGLITNP